MVSAWEGRVRVMREVLVQHNGDSELVVLSDTPAVLGEELALDVTNGSESTGLKVKVLGSRPVIVDGTVSYQVRLQKLESS